MKKKKITQVFERAICGVIITFFNLIKLIILYENRTQS